MVEPVSMTVGSLIASALASGAGAFAKGVLGEAATEAYTKVRQIVVRWAGGDVEALEAAAKAGQPTEKREDLIAETIDAQPEEKLAEAQAFAAELVEMLRQEVAARGPVGIDVGKLEAIEVNLRNMKVREGIGFRADEVKAERFDAPGLEVGSKNS